MILAGLVLGLSFMAMTVSAQKATTDNQKKAKTEQTVAGKCQFVDKNNDGKCDNCGAKQDCCKAACDGKGKTTMNCSGMNGSAGCGKNMDNCQKKCATAPEKK